MEKFIAHAQLRSYDHSIQPSFNNKYKLLILVIDKALFVTCRTRPIKSPSNSMKQFRIIVYSVHNGNILTR